MMAATAEEETSFDSASTDNSDGHAADIIEPTTIEPNSYDVHKSTKTLLLSANDGQTDIMEMNHHNNMNSYASTMVMEDDDLYNNHDKDIEIEQLKHEKLILEEWKTEIGLIAVQTVDTLSTQIEIQQNTVQQYQLEIEGLQTQNHALSQQISAYQDEVRYILYLCYFVLHVPSSHILYFRPCQYIMHAIDR